MTTANQYNPDYATPPGWVLEEYLEVRRLSQSEFARRCGCSPKLISEIISGKARIKPETALQFERTLGLGTKTWLNMEATYRMRKAGVEEAEQIARMTKKAKEFPISELVKRGAFEKPRSESDAVLKLLAFFGAGTVGVWNHQLENLVRRQSATCKNVDAVVATWLRLGAREGEQQDCGDYDTHRFKRAVQKKIRRLTSLPIDEAFQQAKDLCNKAGVALVVVPPFRKMTLGGAAWRMLKSPIIQLSSQHKTSDQFWFAFFHEAAHILLHPKKMIFLDEKNSEGVDGDKKEREANEWATNTLIPKKVWSRFVSEFQKSEREVVRFAKQQGIAPGIVVNLLQREEVLPRNRLNHLKEKYEGVGVATDPAA